jgi:hypothetical protein
MDLATHSKDLALDSTGRLSSREHTLGSPYVPHSLLQIPRFRRISF